MTCTLLCSITMTISYTIVISGRGHYKPVYRLNREAPLLALFQTIDNQTRRKASSWFNESPSLLSPILISSLYSPLPLMAWNHSPTSLPKPRSILLFCPAKQAKHSSLLVSVKSVILAITYWKLQSKKRCVLLALRTQFATEALRLALFTATGALLLNRLISFNVSTKMLVGAAVSPMINTILKVLAQTAIKGFYVLSARINMCAMGDSNAENALLRLKIFYFC